MKRVLFIDRDGTLIEEPITDQQVDSLEKLVFYPGVFRFLSLIAEEMDFELVMVTNQDGLGTDSFPEDTFWPAHDKMMQTLKGESISFDEVLIDRTFENENKDTRKPGLGMMGKYLGGAYDLENSYVIGDRLSDMELAKNLGAKGILIASSDANSYNEEVQVLQTTSWKAIYTFLKGGARKSRIHRKTKETDILVELNLDGQAQSNIETGLGFFDHMLEQISRHSGVDLDIQVKGDLQVDEHHTIEDTAIALGEAFRLALGDKKGIERYGFCLPMDEALTQLALDFGGRAQLVWEAEFRREKIGDMPTEMFYHFFKSFCDGALCNLNIKVEGINEHHKIESVFKALARAIRMAISRDVYSNSIPSTKGSL